MSVYLAVDLGTTGCRSILFNEKLQEVGSAYEEYGLITPKSGWVEQDANCWWDLTLKTAEQAIQTSGIDPKQIDGISVSSQGITVVPVDEAMNPLCNAISWLDARTVEETAQIARDWGQKLFILTGKPTETYYTLTKMLWLQKEKPEIWKKAWKFLMPMDFLLGKLCGNPVTDHSMASGTLMYDLRNCCWSKKVLDMYGIEESRLPEIRWSGECAGTVLPEVAEKLGLRKDCAVAVGAQDQKCAALGAGLKDGTMTISLGTAGAITKYWKTVETETVTNVGWCGYTEPGSWVTEGVINTAGTCLRWTRDEMFRGEGYDVINAEAKAAMDRGSKLMFYPYMSGPSAPDFYPDSQGCFYGVDLSTKRGDFAAAVMEGIAYQIRILLEAMEAYGAVDQLVLFGGGSKSPLWCQIIADITGMEILVPTTSEAAGAGAAVLAARGAGKDLPCLDYAHTYSCSERKNHYEKTYQIYRSIEKKLWQ